MDCDKTVGRSWAEKEHNTSIPVCWVGALKMLDVKMTDVKLTDQMTGHEIGPIAGHNRAGYETDSEAANV